MPLSDDERQTLTEKLEQARRLSDVATDPTTVARITQLILELEERLKEEK